MAVALSFGALLLGTIADRMRRRGISPHALLSAVAIIFVAAQLALILRLPLPSSISWSVVSAVGAGTVLSYAIIAEYFPKELAGRANAALNVFHLGWAFVFQWSTGLILEQWPSQDGHYPLLGYQVAFASTWPCRSQHWSGSSCPGSVLSVQHSHQNLVVASSLAGPRLSPSRATDVDITEIRRKSHAAAAENA